MVYFVSAAVLFGGVSTASAQSGLVSSGTKAPQSASKNAGPLPPGNAAGIRQAQGSSTNDWILIGGGILVGAGILVLVAGGGNDNSTPATTTGTN